jgi:biotin carboxyl carrier protein
MKKFTAALNGTEYTLRYDSAQGQFELNGERFPASVAQIAPGRFSILLDDLSLDVRVVPVESADGTARYRVPVGNVEFLAEVSDPRRWRRGASAAQAAGAQRITAPMPGKVVRVLVRQGQAVEAGQGLVVVEAMKMQNEIKSPKAGTVGVLTAAEGQTVAAGQALLVIE